MKPGGSSDDSDSDGDNFIEDRNALALKLRDGKYFRLSLDVGPRIPPQVPYVTTQELGWVRCDRPSKEINACTHRIRMNCTYRSDITSLSHSEPVFTTVNPECPTNPGSPPPVELEISGDIPTLAWHFHWERRYYYSIT